MRITGGLESEAVSSSLAKPARRSAKPRRPIKRSRPACSTIRKIRTVGKAGSRTSKRRKARKAGKLLCDRLWAQVIKRDGRCVFEGQILSRGVDELDAECPYGPGCMQCRYAAATNGWANAPHVCKGGLQAMHCIPKGPYPSARYKLWNGIPGCAGAHTYFTHRPEIFVLWLQSRWGDALYAERLRDANYPAKHDYAAIAAKLQERLP